MIFKTIPVHTTIELLKGSKDILTKAKKDNDDYFKKIRCVSCGGEVVPFIHPVMNATTGQRSPFKTGDILPNYLAKCKICAVEFEPYTGIQTTLPI